MNKTLSSYELCEKSLRKLHEYNKKGQSDSVDADNIRDIMDKLWTDLTEEEKEQIRELSSKLSGISIDVIDQWETNITDIDLLNKYVSTCLEEQLDQSLYKKVKVINVHTGKRKVQVLLKDCGGITEEDIEEVNLVLDNVIRKIF